MSSLPAIQPSVSVGPSLPRDIPRRPSGQIAITVPSHLSISAKSPVGGLTQSQGDRFSPHTASVNQNGSFDFDRVIKSGTVQKRTRKTKVRLWEPKKVGTPEIDGVLFRRLGKGFILSYVLTYFQYTRTSRKLD